MSLRTLFFSLTCAAAASAGSVADLPAPYATPSVKNLSKAEGWPAGLAPKAEGLKVTRFAEALLSPRNLYVGPNGDVFTAEANTEVKGVRRLGARALGYGRKMRLEDSANRITMLRDANHDGVPELRTVFLENLNQPYGMLIHEGFFYVANTDGLWRYPYTVGQTKITAPGQKLLDLPAGGYNNHWTRNVVLKPGGKKLFVSVGSGSNVAEHGIENERRRADILEVNLDGTGERIYAGGLRNPAGLAIEPVTHTLWTAVNERDELGDELVPDYITSVKEGGFYGWPYSYFGNHLDPRVKEQRPDLVAKALVPDVPVGAHTASLGLAFSPGAKLGEKYREGAFVGQRGSWNRSTLSGYQVAFVPFKGGKPAGPQEPFLTGFIKDEARSEVYGRPVAVAFLGDGSLLVTDDMANIIWRVSR